MVDTVRIHPDDLRESKGTFVLKNDVIVQVPQRELESMYVLGATDADRIDSDGTVKIPVTWLVGGRVGY